MTERTFEDRFGAERSAVRDMILSAVGQEPNSRNQAIEIGPLLQILSLEKSLDSRIRSGPFPRRCRLSEGATELASGRQRLNEAESEKPTPPFPENFHVPVETAHQWDG